MPPARKPVKESDAGVVSPPEMIDDMDDVEVYPPPWEPMAVAREIISDLQRDEKDSLYYWRASWMGWQGAQWREAEEVEIKRIIYTTLENAVYVGPEKMEAWLPNKSRVANVMDAMMAISHLSMTVSPPVWLSDQDTPVRDIVSFTNGLLSVSTRELSSHTPDFFTLVSVPFEYDKNAAKPVRWLKFLDDLWPGDQESISTLQEWFGYIISGRTDIQKMLMMVGPPRSGKGTIARILTSLIGVRNTASPTLSSFDSNFGLQPLLGKSLAIISDARLKPGTDKRVIERLLSISGEDSITADRKYREPYIGPIPVRFLIISNEIPKFGDSSGAMANRFIILQLTRSWLTKEDTKLTGRLMEELPGIMLWALEGLDRIVWNGDIKEPKASSRARNIMREISSPVQAFVKDRCVISPKGEAEVQRVYDEWRTWCEENGIVYITDKRTFGRDLHAAMPKLSNIQKRAGDKRIRYYRGLRLRSQGKSATQVTQT